MSRRALQQVSRWLGVAIARQYQPYHSTIRPMTYRTMWHASCKWSLLMGGGSLQRMARMSPELHSQRRGMFIQTQPTPNPSSLMFLPGKKVMETGSVDFTSAREAMASPLATKLFRIDGVQGVFYGSDFITIKKDEDVNWSIIKPQAFAAIMDHFTSSEPLFVDGHTSPSDTAISEDDSEVVAMIKELLETRIKPAVQEDGGDIVFMGFNEETGVVTLKMQGACSGCPSSSVTLKSGIENMLMHYIPEVKEVVQAEPDDSENAGLAAFNKLEQHLSP